MAGIATTVADTLKRPVADVRAALPRWLIHAERDLIGSVGLTKPSPAVWAYARSMYASTLDLPVWRYYDERIVNFDLFGNKMWGKQGRVNRDVLPTLRLVEQEATRMAGVQTVAALKFAAAEWGGFRFEPQKANLANKRQAIWAMEGAARTSFVVLYSNCGLLNRADAETCVRCGEPLEAEGKVAQGRRPFLLMTLALIAICILLCAAAYKSEELLQHALHPQTSEDVAAFVCTSLKTQNYAQLTSKLDPAATPTPTPTTSAAKTPAKTPTLNEELRGLDSSNGKVTTCSYQLLSENQTSAQYAVTLKRAKMPVPMGLVLVLSYHSTGAWIISPATNFTGQPG